MMITVKQDNSGWLWFVFLCSLSLPLPKVFERKDGKIVIFKSSLISEGKKKAANECRSVRERERRNIVITSSWEVIRRTKCFESLGKVSMLTETSTTTPEWQGKVMNFFWVVHEMFFLCNRFRLRGNFCKTNERANERITPHKQRLANVLHCKEFNFYLFPILMILNLSRNHLDDSLWRRWKRLKRLFHKRLNWISRLMSFISSLTPPPLSSRRRRRWLFRATTSERQKKIFLI